MTTIEELHACYCQMTHLEIRLPVWERAFNDFLAHGFTCADLQLVLGHIQRENRRMNGARFSLRLNTLLDYQYERFDSLLSEAKAMQRNRVQRTPAEKVLASRTGGESVTVTANTARPIRDVLKTMGEKL